MNKNTPITLKASIILAGLLTAFAALFGGRAAIAGTLSCTVSTSCAGGTVIWRMASTTNSHAEMPTQSNYANLVCCTGVTGLSNSCTGSSTIALKLASTTNAHSEQNTQSNYSNNACISVPGGSVSIGYQASNCSGFDTTLGSMATTTNSHVGDANAYSIKICGTGVSAPQSLTFSISANSIGFGSLSAAAPRYATSNLLGTTTEAEAHQLLVSTNASSGYAVTMKGSTLTSGVNTVNAIGGTNTASAAGTEQFGIRMTATGGSGAVTAPYAASGFADAATASTTSQVASAATGDGVTTTYSVRYIANVAATTESGSYATTLNYVATANF